MKKLRGSLAAKITAVMLLSALVLVCLLSSAGTAYLYDMGVYSGGYESAARRAVSERAYSACAEAGSSWLRGSTDALYEDGNFRYTITSHGGEELFSNYGGEDALWSGTQTVVPNFWVERWTDEEIAPEELLTDGEPEEPAVVTPTPQPTLMPSAQPKQTEIQITVYDNDRNEELQFTSEAEYNAWRNERSLEVKGYVLAALEKDDDFSAALRNLERLSGWRKLLPVAAVASFVLGVLLFLFLLSAAGHRDETDTVTPNFVDRIPLDLFTLLIAGGVAIVLSGLFNAGLDGDFVGYTLGLFLALLIGLQFLLFCMSFAVRVKCGTLWQNCLITRLWRWCVRVLKGGARLLVKGLRALPLLWRWAAILGGILLLELLILWTGEDGGSVNWFLNAFLVTPLLLFLIWNMRRLRLGAKEIAGGNTDYTIDTKYLFWELKEHAEDLNHIRDGMNRAVEERMKSEHFKSELITNVSHDIKTPLTSIVNYVDLLSREELGNETAKEYVGVLARQSAKLKKLIDDLIEASKASTGVLPVNNARCELGVLLDQCAGEYAERLGKAELELVVLKPEKPVTVLADGRHMWRIFDNLLGNIVKYAQPGTRVYLSLTEEGGKARITFRNISREALNLSGEELMERFVRGDSSRNTEGSGLGLAIARSLAQLQGGEMDLTVDGDLFKVVLSFDTVA